MVYLIVALVLALIVAVVAVQNASPVDLVFFKWSVQTSLVPVILGAAAMGAVTVGLSGFVRQLGMRIRIWDLQSRMRTLESELSAAKEVEKRLTEEIKGLRARVESMGAESRGSVREGDREI